MIEKRKRTQPSGDITEDLDAHLHRDRAGIETDPVRSAMLGAQRDSVSAANTRLPVRQREVLALREVEGMSYEEIAKTMNLNSNSVAQLISRARTNLRNEVRLDVAASVAPVSADCERALPLLAMRQDGELDSPEQRIWLETHLTGCSGCRVANEEMAEAGVSYRAWVPALPAAYLFRNTLAKASEALGTDWSGIERPVGRAEVDPESVPHPGPGPNRGKFRAITATAVLLMVIGVAYLAAGVDDATREVDPAEPSSVETSVIKDKKQPAKKKEKAKKKPAETTSPEPATSVPAATPSREPTDPDNSGKDRSPRPSGGGGIQGGNGSNNGSNQPADPPAPLPDPTPPPVTTPPTPPVEPPVTPPTNPNPPRPPTKPPPIKG